MRACGSLILRHFLYRKRVCAPGNQADRAPAPEIRTTLLSLVCNRWVLECSWVLRDFDRVRVDQFKQFTKEKLRGVRCPHHRQPPRLHFSGTSLRDVTITMSGCCGKLMELANARIASAPADADMRKPA